MIQELQTFKTKKNTMILINRLLEFQAEVCEILRDENNHKIFGYSDMIIDDSELSKILKDRTKDQNTFLISVMPDGGLKGEENSLTCNNALSFFILDKTDYSEFDRDGYRNIFVSTQQKAQMFLNHIIQNKYNSCGLLNGLKENSINYMPVWKKESCNGWMITLNIDTLL